MQIITTNKLTLNTLETDFSITFKTTKKRGVDKDYWFTDGGHCRIWFGSLATQFVGKIDDETYSYIVKNMRKDKTDILTDLDGNLFTICNGGISKIINHNLIKYIQEEYDIRFA